jgi:hypothetical protein
MAIQTGKLQQIMMAIRLVSAFCLITVIPGQVLAQERFRPANNTVVLKTSIASQTKGNDAFKAIDTAWRKQPQDIQAATAYARAVFILGLDEGDLRWYGSAKAALMPWWQESQLPAETLFIRGLVKQGFHEFHEGLHDIDLAIAQNPRKAEYWSWRFALNLLLSDFKSAEKDCAQIEIFAGRLEALQHRAVLHYRSGRADLALQILTQLQQSSEFSKHDSEWFQFQLGEAYRVAGQYRMALSIWRQQLATMPQSHLIRLSLAELLNKQSLFSEAQKITDIENASDALLMQALLAARGLKDRKEQKLSKLIESRLATQSLRNESLIERPKLIYLIDYGIDPKAGLQLSIENWKIQQEPRDAVLFVKAALQAQQPQAAEPVVSWVQQTNYADPELAGLLNLLNEQRKRLGTTK